MWLMTLAVVAVWGCTESRPPASSPSTFESKTLALPSDFVAVPLEEESPTIVEPQPCAERVEITWLGVTTYALSYLFEGRRVRILLDHQINGAYYQEVMATLGFEALDYVVIGHNHFDHTGDCLEQGDLLCGGALVTSGAPELEWEGAPYEQLAVGTYGAKALGPHRACASLDVTRCQGLWSLDGVQRFELTDIGLTITAFPSAHSVVLPILDDEREHPTDDEPDPYSYIFEFPAERQACRTSMLWASSTLSNAPYLSYVETLVSESQSYTFDYAALVDEALALHGQPITYWAFAAASLPGVEAWSLWANRILPSAWSNHHHGAESAEYFPDLHLPGPAELSLRDIEWLEAARVGDSAFLPLDDWWTTVELHEGKARLLPERRAELQEAFRARLTPR